MSHDHFPTLNVVVVPPVVSDNFDTIGLKAILTPGYLESILSHIDMLFYKFLNTSRCRLDVRLGINAETNYAVVKEPLVWDKGTKDLIHSAFTRAFIGSVNDGTVVSPLTKTIHALVYESLDLSGIVLFYTLLGVEENNVILGITNDPQHPKRIKNVSEFIATFYEQYGLGALAQANNYVYLNRLVENAVQTQQRHSA